MMETEAHADGVIQLIHMGAVYQGHVGILLEKSALSSSRFASF